MTLRWATFAILSAVLAFGVDWAPYYVSIYFGDSVTVLGSIDKFAQPCSEVLAESKCTDKYVIPRELFPSKLEGISLGTGMIISAATYTCVGSQRAFASFDNPRSPGRLFETLTTYQTVDLTAVPCDEGIDIKAWSRPNARRHGHIAGSAVLGSTRAVERVKRLSEFFTQDLLLLLSFVFLALFALSKMVFSLLGGALRSSPFERALWAWVAFAITGGGLVQILFPITDFPQWSNRLNAIFSIICHGMPVLYILSVAKRSNKYVKRVSTFLVSSVRANIPVSPLSIATVLLMLLPNFAFSFQIIVALTAMIAVVGGILTREPDLICYSAVFSLGVLKLFGVSGLPAPYITLLFVGMTVANELIIRFTQGARLTQIVFWARNMLAGPDRSRNLTELAVELFRQVGANRLTLLMLGDQGSCRLLLISRNDMEVHTELLVRDELPPVFAHAISSRAAIWHLSEDDPRMINIRRGQRPAQSYSGSFLTVIPLHGDTFPVGAIAFTDYPAVWAHDPEKNLELTTVLKLMQPLLVEQIQASEIRSKSEFSVLVTETCQHIASQKSGLPQKEAEDYEKSIRHIYSKCLETISSKLHCYGFLGELDHQTRKFDIHAVHGYHAAVAERLTKGALYALKENEQGPLAMAVNQDRTIIVSDVRLLRGVLHENTVLFFEKSGTKSCAAIPIYTTTRDSLAHATSQFLWGVLFIERNIDDPFTLQHVSDLDRLASTFGELIADISQQALLDKTRRALSAFVPNRVLNRVISENIQREDDRGMFLMIDLRESTRIALGIGSEKWLKNAQSLIPTIEAIANSHGYSMQVFNWDAFYLTRSNSDLSLNDISKTLDLIAETTPCIEAWYQENYPEYSREHQKARFCITHGDVSRGFSSGTTKTWTIVGTEMPAMCKFEDVCKKLDGVVFADSSVSTALDAKTWIDTKLSVPSTKRDIFKLRVQWVELLVVGSKKTAA